MKTKVVFFGTHEFGAGMLKGLLGAGVFDIVGVVTQPDRPTGRKQEMKKSAVKELSERNGLQVFQPETLKNFDLNIECDLAVVCQYGLIIPKRILEIPKHGSINVHTSLLPKFRGASPIQSAIVSGEKETGVTIMQMDEKMDHGPILAFEKVKIDPDETYPELEKQLEPIARNLLLDTLPKWLAGQISPVVQNDNDATFCKMYSREDGKINWSDPAKKIYDLYRGLLPWPGVWTVWSGTRLKVLQMALSEKEISPGVIKLENEELLIGTSQGSIKIIKLQIEGGRPLDSKSFLAGHQDLIGSKLE